MFDAIAAVVPASANVWEPGCGSGQATRGLATRFAHVHRDRTQREADRAALGERGERRAMSASRSNRASARRWPTRSVELVAVAQALHWFDREPFFAECERVLTPGGVLAAWTYQDMVVPDGCSPAVEAFRAQIEPYWPSERAQVDAGYAGYDWPFPALPAPSLWLDAEWSLPQLLGYLGSLSAVARCRTATGERSGPSHAAALAAAWGEPREPPCAGR